MTAIQSRVHRKRNSAIIKKRVPSKKEVLLDDFLEKKC